MRIRGFDGLSCKKITREEKKPYDSDDSYDTNTKKIQYVYINFPPARKLSGPTLRFSPFLFGQHTWRCGFVQNFIIRITVF